MVYRKYTFERPLDFLVSPLFLVQGAALGPGGIVWGALSTTLVVAVAGAASFGIVRVLEN